MKLFDKLIPKADDSHEFKPILAEIEDAPLNPIGNTVFWLIMIFMLMMKYHAQNPVLKFFGNLSLETYMMNLIALCAFRFIIYNQNHVPVYKAGHYNLAVYEVAVIAGTIALAFIYKYVNKFVLAIPGWISKKKKPETDIQSN